MSIVPAASWCEAQMFSHHVSASSPVIAADSRCQVVAVEIFKCMKIFNNDGAPPPQQPGAGSHTVWTQPPTSSLYPVPMYPFSITADILWWPGGLYSERVSVFVQLFATWQTIFPCLGPYSMIDNLCLQLPRILFTKWSFPNIYRQSAVPFQLTYRHDRKCRADCMQHAGANKCMEWI